MLANNKLISPQAISNMSQCRSNPSACYSCRDCVSSSFFWGGSSECSKSGGSCYEFLHQLPCSSSRFPFYYIRPNQPFSCDTACFPTGDTSRVCSTNYGDDGALPGFVILAIALSLWILNVIFIFLFVRMRRKGLDVCTYVVFALFFGILVWPCVIFAQTPDKQNHTKSAHQQSAAPVEIGLSIQKPASSPVVYPRPIFTDANSIPNPYGRFYVQVPPENVPNPYGEAFQNANSRR
jgi:hypothetical protein